LFVGKGHHAAVKTLVDRFHRLDESGPVLACLVAPPGWGKTRVVQEFYAELASAQPTPPYWPKQLERDDGPEMRSILEGRKRLYPAEILVPADATLPWFWWAILCQRRLDGTFAQSIFDDATQLYAHADSILGRIGAGDATGRAFDASSSIVGLIGLLGVTLFPPAGIAMGVAGAARTGWQNRDLIEKVKRFQQERGERPLDAGAYGRIEQVEEIATQLVALSKAVPIVLVVDDAHYADDTLVETINIALRSPAAQILVVAMAWPQELDDKAESAPFPAWWNSDLEPGIRKRLTRIDLGALDKKAAQQLVAADLPQAASSLLASIIGRWGTNPLVLRTLVRLPRVRAALTDGTLNGDPDSRLPQQLEAILGEYWSNLPADVRGALSLASRLGAEFVPSVVVDAAPSAGAPDGVAAVRQAVTPYAWIREYDPTLHGFVEAALWQIACRGADDLLDQNATKSLSLALEGAVKELCEDGTGVSERTLVTLWRQHIAFVEDGFLPQNELAAWSGLRLAEHLATRLQYEDAVRLSKAALEWSSFPRYEEAIALRNLGEWLRQTGRFEESLAQLRVSVSELEDEGARLEAAKARRALGDTYRYLGDLDAAVKCFTVALESFEAFGELRGAAASLSGIGDAYRGLSKWDRSEDYLRKCLGIYGDLGDEQQRARALVRYGMVFRDRWQNDKAEAACSEALPVFRQCGDRRWEARTVRNLGIIDRNEGRLKKACDHFCESEAIFSELHDERGRAVTLRNRGDTYRLMDDFVSATRDLNEALEIFRRIGDRRWESRAKLGLGDMYRRQKDWARAQTMIFSARDFYADVGDVPAEARALRAEGLLMRDSGQLEAARSAFGKCRELFERLGDELWVARAIMGEASVANLAEEPAEDLEKHAEKICRDLGATDEETRKRWLAEW
jgi:tetratricopeptide (TPR) repeat protein